MTSEQALSFVCTRGVVLESGAGPETSMAEEVAGEAIRGSWWAHAQGREIFAVTRDIRSCPDVLVCRLLGVKITYVHKRLWPAMVRLADRTPASGLAKIGEMHSSTGRHVTEEIPYPHWIPEAVIAEARDLSDADAIAQFGSWSERILRPI